MTAGRPREFDYDKALDQAMHVFWQKGYEGTSMPDLTDAMGINRPSIYSAFGNKEELFRKALELYLKKSMEKAREALSAPKLHDAIENFLMGAAGAYACNKSPKGCMAVQGALACSDEAEKVRLEATKRREEMFALLHERFEKGLKDKELPPKTDTKALARFYTTILHGMSVQSSSGTCGEELAKIVENALKILPV